MPWSWVEGVGWREPEPSIGVERGCGVQTGFVPPQGVAMRKRCNMKGRGPWVQAVAVINGSPGRGLYRAIHILAVTPAGPVVIFLRFSCNVVIPHFWRGSGGLGLLGRELGPLAPLLASRGRPWRKKGRLRCLVGLGLVYLRLASILEEMWESGAGPLLWLWTTGFGRAWVLVDVAVLGVVSQPRVSPAGSGSTVDIAARVKVLLVAPS